MEFDAFLDLYDSGGTQLKGESDDSKHNGMLQCSEFGFGVSHPVDMSVGSGAASGKTTFDDLTITIRQSKASPTLFHWGASGEHLKKGTLYVRKNTGKDPADFMMVHLEGAFVTKLETKATGGPGGMNETLSLAYTSIVYEYHMQKPDGSVDGTAYKGGWNLKQNKKV